VPRVATTLTLRDHLGTIGARTGLTRNDYRLTPGLYCLGSPDAASPVLVTANYKLTFDSLRRQLTGIDAWLLVIDSRGINVWCSAGKGTFSSEEIAYQVQRCRLAEIVSHRQLILPQLSANGVTAHKLKELCGFRGRFGPILASDLPEYLQRGEASEKMRTITFTLAERAVLVPLELCIIWKQLAIATLIFFVLSGIGPEVFSINSATARLPQLLTATLAALLAGAVLVPLLLPWLPFRRFWVKGAMVGTMVALMLLAALPDLGLLEQAALLLWVSGSASFLAMNFTGSTPYTSLSGVAQEMKGGLAFQIGATVIAGLLWPLAAFF
jgi:CO dehydrogenase/acetyl-CoA synthase delta subunit